MLPLLSIVRPPSGHSPSSPPVKSWRLVSFLAIEVLCGIALWLRGSAQSRGCPEYGRDELEDFGDCPVKLKGELF